MGKIRFIITILFMIISTVLASQDSGTPQIASDILPLDTRSFYNLYPSINQNNLVSGFSYSWYSDDISALYRFGDYKSAFVIPKFAYSFSSENLPIEFRFFFQEPGRDDSIYRFHFTMPNVLYIKTKFVRIPVYESTTSKTNLNQYEKGQWSLSPEDHNFLNTYMPGDIFNPLRLELLTGRGEKTTLKTQRDLFSTDATMRLSARWYLDLYGEQYRKSGAVSFDSINATGFQPDSIFSSIPVGNPLFILEIPRGVSERNTTLRVSADFLGRANNLSVSASATRYDNDIESISWTNPYIGLMGRAKLPDDSWAYSTSLSWKNRFSGGGKIMGTVTWERAGSRIDLLPFRPGSDSTPLPFTNLEARAVNLSGKTSISLPIGKRISWEGSYSYRSHKNNTPETSFPSYSHPVWAGPYYDALNPGNYGIPRKTSYTDFIKKNLVSNLIFNLTKSSNITLILERQEFDRSKFRNRAFTHDDAFKIRYNIRKGSEWFGSVTGGASRRAGSAFRLDYYSAFPLHPLQRTFDTADKEKVFANAHLRWAPIENFTLESSMDWQRSVYSDTKIGIRYDSSYSADLNGEWIINEDLVVGVGTGRYFDWIGGLCTNYANLGDITDPLYPSFRYPSPISVKERYNTYEFTSRWKPIEKMIIDAEFIRYQGYVNYEPDIKNNYAHTRTKVSALFSLTAKIGIDLLYLNERYSRNDFFLDEFTGPGDKPNPASPTDIFMGIKYPGGRLEIIRLLLRYSF